MLSTSWHWVVVIVSVLNILACWWLLRWSANTKVNSDDNTTGHVWDEDLQELNNPLPRWWLGMFNLSIIIGLIYLYFYPGLGNYEGSLNWTQENQLVADQKTAEESILATQQFWNEYSEENLLANTVPIETGERVFANNCAMCHGSGGKGALSYPNLVDADWQWGEGFDFIVDAVTNGRQAVMQPWLEEFGEQGVKEVVEYVQKIGGIKYDETLAVAGEAHYNKTCIACHGSTGTGMQALGAPNLSDRHWLYGSTDEALYETIANGRMGNMPAHENLLNEYKIRAVAAYVQHMADQHKQK